MAFSVKDFWSYTDDPTTVKDLVLLAAKPGGGGFSLVNMTKEEFLNIANTMAIKFNPTTNTDIIILNDPNSAKVRYQNALDWMWLDNLNQLMFSDDGSNNEQIEIRNDTISSIRIGGFSPTNGNKGGTLSLFTDSSTFQATIESIVTVDTAARLANVRKGSAVSGTLQYREDTGAAGGTIGDGGTTVIDSRLYSIVPVEPTGGGIASHTFEMPEAIENDRVRIAIFGTITTITMTTPGPETIQAPLTTASGSFQWREWIYTGGGPGEWKIIGL